MRQRVSQLVATLVLQYMFFFNPCDKTKVDTIANNLHKVVYPSA